MKRMYLKGQSPSKRRKEYIPLPHKHKIVLILQGDFGVVPVWKPDKNKMPNHVWVFLTEMVRDLGLKELPRSWDKNALRRKGIIFCNTNHYIGDKVRLFSILSRHSYACDKAVYILMGKYPWKYEKIVARRKHLVLKTSSLRASYHHPGAPFIGCGAFTKACDFLKWSRDVWKFD